jgi:hypothetical protein
MKIIKEEKRLSKQQLMILYSVTRGTIENWRKNYGLPIIEISSHSKFVKLEDLLEWENSMISKNKLVEELSI